MGSMLSQWRSVETKRRLLVVDATVLTGPGSKGVDFRAHVLYDPYRAIPCGVDVTTAKGGETFARHNLRPGDLVIGDRGYGHFRGFIAALRMKADVLVRVEPGQMKLTTLTGERTHLKELAQEVPVTGSESFDLVWHGPERDCRKVRIIGTRTQKGEVCWLATNLNSKELPSARAAELYGIRWQIELLFKRLKSLLDLDELRSREGPTAKAFIYAKLITAFLALRFSDNAEAFSPYGYDVTNVPQEQEPLERVSASHQRRRGSNPWAKKVVAENSNEMAA
jgi:hypothetical protein